MVATLWVMSSPVVPSPRVAARTSTPLRYSRFTARPSILTSLSHATVGAPGNCSTCCWARVNHATSSSVEKTSSSEYIFSRCFTGLNAAETSPPTSCVGESFALSSGCRASNSSRERYNRSYSASDMTGWSWT